MIMLKVPAQQANANVTLIHTWLASDRPAPIRLAIRVLAAMPMGKGIWKVMRDKVARTDCAASAVVERCADASVSISNARNSDITITNPGIASRIMGSQF